MAHGSRAPRALGCRRAILVPIVLASLIGCNATAPDDERSPNPTPTSRAPEPTADPDDPLDRRTRLAQDLWPATPPADDGPLPARLDIAAIASARWLHEAPVAGATMAVGMSAFGDEDALEPGSVAVLAADGSWRRVSLSAAGIADENNPEQQFALSPDGTQLALGDANAVVVLDLRAATARRLRVPAREPVALSWAPDGRSLILCNRNEPATGLLLRYPSGQVTAGDFNAFASGPGPRRRVLELASTEEKGSQARIWQDGTIVDAVTLEQPLRGREALVWLEDAAFVQRHSRLPDGRSVAGVVTVDVASGHFTGVLPLENGQLNFTTVLGWSDVDTVIVKVDARAGGSVVAWSPRNRKLVRLSSFEASGLQVSLATDRF